MMVDLKSEGTDADIAELIASVEDNRDWRLEVDANGIAQLSDKTTNPTGPEYDEGLHCFMETWALGTDFVGRHAASDKDLVSKIAKALREKCDPQSGEVRLGGFLSPLGLTSLRIPSEF